MLVINAPAVPLVRLACRPLTTSLPGLRPTRGQGWVAVLAQRSRHLAHPGAASWVRGRRGGSGCPWTGHGAPRATLAPVRAVPVNPLWLRVPRVTEVGLGFEPPSLTPKPDRSGSHSPAHTKSRATSWDQFSRRVDPRNPTCWGHRLNPCEGSVTSDNNVADVG